MSKVLLFCDMTFVISNSEHFTACNDTISHIALYFFNKQEVCFSMFLVIVTGILFGIIETYSIDSDAELYLSRLVVVYLIKKH